MTRYWKLIAIGLITVISFTLFYIDIGNLSKQFPQFKINDIAGEATEIDHVQVEGEIYFDAHFYNETFQVDKSGTSFYRDTPYFKRLHHTYAGPKIEKLATNYRNFMRGKDVSPNYFYADEDIVAYANETYGFGGLSSNKFVIDVLDKDSNKATGFSLMIPNRSEYWYIDIKKVLVSDNNLYIITQSEPSDNMTSNQMDNSQVVNVYNIDLTKQEIIDVAKVNVLDDLPKGTANVYVEIETVFSEDNSSGEFFIVANKTTYHEPEQSNGYTDEEYGFEEIQTIRAIKYNFKTDEQKEIPLDGESSLGMLLYFDEETVSFVKLEKDAVIFKKVNEASNKVLFESELAIELQNGYDLLYAPIKDHKLYPLSINYEVNEMTSVPLYVIDLTDFEITYQGEVTLDESNIQLSDMHYYLNGVSIIE